MRNIVQISIRLSEGITMNNREIMNRLDPNCPEVFGAEINFHFSTANHQFKQAYKQYCDGKLDQALKLYSKVRDLYDSILTIDQVLCAKISLKIINQLLITLSYIGDIHIEKADMALGYASYQEMRGCYFQLDAIYREEHHEKLKPSVVRMYEAEGFAMERKKEWQKANNAYAMGIQFFTPVQQFSDRQSKQIRRFEAGLERTRGMH